MPATLPERDLAGLFSSFGEGLSLDAFMENALGNCVEWFEASRVSLFLRADETGEYRLIAQAGPKSDLPLNSFLRVGEGVAGKAIAVGKPMLLDVRGKQGSSARGGTAMVVPLVTPESGCLGVLNVSRANELPAFTSRDLKTAETIARYVALAVANAQLFSRMNHAVAQAQALTEKLDAVIACLGVGVLVVTEFQEVSGWNPEAQRLFGERLGSGVLLRHVVAELPKPLREGIEEVFMSAAGGERTTRQAHDPTSEQWWNVIGSPLPSGGATLAVQDVTEHERMQKELGRVTRLAEIGQMTAAIAHEIRNPLTGIRTAAQMIQRDVEEAAEYGRIVEEEALKLNELCDQFLDFARPVALDIEDVDAVKIAKRVAELERPQFEQRGVSFDLSIRSAAPIIKGDPLKLEQVIRNLVMNALQACSAGDRVTVEVDGPRVVVRDTGCGIEPYNMDLLFTPFFTTKPSGTGLGLSTVRKIADAHGWVVSVRSRSGVGTAFEVDLGGNGA